MRKVISISVISVVLLLSLLCGGCFGVSYYRQLQASKLVAVVRQIHPGTTTEARTQILLEPFAKYRTESTSSVLEFQFANFMPRPIPVAWTLFIARFEFAGGSLAEIDLTEMQVDHQGYPHPNSASVSIRSNRLRPSPADFNGYSEYSRSTGSIDPQGKWTGFNCCHARSIKLDERATPDQFSRSLDFRLSCMTSLVRCKDDRQILP
jgi:hypothetical protein